MSSKAEHIVLIAVTAMVVASAAMAWTSLDGRHPDQDMPMETVAHGSIRSTVELTCAMDGTAIESKGTGFVASHGGESYIVTCAHIVTYGGIALDDIRFRFYNSDAEYRSIILSLDEGLDIAILSIPDECPPVKPLAFGDSDRLRYSQRVLTIGNGLGYGLAATDGTVSIPLVNVKQDGDRPMVQTNININRGSSGGPLLDLQGDVVGMMSFRLNNIGGLVQGMSFATPSNVIVSYVEEALV